MQDNKQQVNEIIEKQSEKLQEFNSEKNKRIETLKQLNGDIAEIKIENAYATSKIKIAQSFLYIMVFALAVFIILTFQGSRLASIMPNSDSI